MKQRIFTLQQSIKKGTAALEAAGIEEAALDAWYLLEYTTGISRAAYYGEPDRVMEEYQVRQYLEYVEERKKRIPLQHITGEQEFMGYPFYVNEHVLIPRQDTETLVLEAVRILREETEIQRRDSDECSVGRGKKKRILDLCTGSGCVLLSIMKMCPDVEGTGCDISREALKTAKKNAERLEVEAVWVEADLFRGLDSLDDTANETDGQTASGSMDVREGGGFSDPVKYDMIVSNPPYIRTSDIDGLQEEVRLYDPRIALDGGEDGLQFYRRIIEDSIFHIVDGGSLLFEIGYDQGRDVAELMRSHGYEDVAIKKDLSGLDRVVMGTYVLGDIRKNAMKRMSL